MSTRCSLQGLRTTAQGVCPVQARSGRARRGADEALPHERSRRQRDAPRVGRHARDSRRAPRLQPRHRSAAPNARRRVRTRSSGSPPLRRQPPSGAPSCSTVGRGPSTVCAAHAVPTRRCRPAGSGSSSRAAPSRRRPLRRAAARGEQRVEHASRRRRRRGARLLAGVEPRRRQRGLAIAAAAPSGTRAQLSIARRSTSHSASSIAATPAWPRLARRAAPPAARPGGRR